MLAYRKNFVVPNRHDFDINVQLSVDVKLLVQIISKTPLKERRCEQKYKLFFFGNFIESGGQISGALNIMFGFWRWGDFLEHIGHTSKFGAQRS